MRFLENGGNSLKFSTVVSSPSIGMFFLLIAMIVTFFVLSFGLRKKLRHIAGCVVSTLLVLVLTLTMRDLFLGNSNRKVAFCLGPSFSGVSNSIVMKTVGRTFFALSANVNNVTVFNDCVNGRRSLVKRTVRIVALSALITFLTNIVVFPTYFAFSLRMGTNPDLLFSAVTTIFGGVSKNHV